MKFFKLIFIIILFFSFCPKAQAEELSVAGVAEKHNVYVGESFAFQIQVEGDESPQEPDVSQIKEFHVLPRGGQQNSSQSVTVINGKVNRISKHGYIFNYSLTPKREGKLMIPAITVVAGGKTFLTKSIIIDASKPQETDDFKLRMRLSKNKCYVGEPVALTVTWYIGKDVEEFSFTLPHQEDSRFTVISQEINQTGGQQDIIKIPVGQQTLYAKKKRGILEGREYLTVQFDQTLIPNETGQFVIPQATVSSKVLQGYDRRRSNDPFDNFFGRNRRGVYSTVITPSSEPKINVLPVPIKGQPADFNGLVGSYSIIAQAAPLEVNVGDPITLTIMVTGPEYLGNVTLPSLQQNQELMRDFKIPDEMAPGEIQGRKKVFTQTIRAQHTGVKVIPALGLSFFNTETQMYETAHSEPIPLQVHQTKIVTVMDAEGEDVVMSNKKDIHALKQGISQNFEDFSILENQEFDRGERLLPTSWLLLLLTPPGLFLLVVGASFIVTRRNQDPRARLAKKAFNNFIRFLKALENEKGKEESLSYINLSEAIRRYLGDKLSLPSQTITFHDVKGMLLNHGVSLEILSCLQKIMDICEEHRYAGGTVSQVKIDSDLKRVKDMVSQIEGSFS
jgi:hypothetical protein